MLHTYEEALNWIHSRLRLGIKPGLKRMEWIMERLEHPERKIKTIHVGGTNGKGSTVTFLRCILEEAGYNVGTFTSPYFEQFNERISVNGKPISDQEMLELTNILYPLAEELDQTELGGPTEFEVITAMALTYFAKKHPVDITIFEVGLGGRFDSTNIIHPILSIITSIGMDHTSILGDTFEQIAFEKAGIIKSGTPVITAVKQPEASQVIETKAIKMNAPLYQLGTEFSISNHQTLPKGEEFTFASSNKNLPELQITMMGKHQTENATLAIMAAQMLNIADNQIRSGLVRAYWPGRLELISEQPTIIMDGAHNEEGIEALVQELTARHKNKHIQILFTALSDKKLDGMIQKLDSVADKVTFTEFNFPRASQAKALYELSCSQNKHIANDWEEFLKVSIPELTENEILVITGSLYFLSEVKPYLQHILKT